MNKFSNSNHNIILNISNISNSFSNILLIHHSQYKFFNHIKTISNKKSITYINNEKLGKYIGTYSKNNNIFFIFINKLSDHNIQPIQTIYLPKEKYIFDIYIDCLNTHISSKILYKHIS